MNHATLCVLSYNRPQFLPRCLETARDAGVPLQIIVHDDGSTDGELLSYLYQAHSEGLISTLILNAPGYNEGQGTALNTMFRRATGDPIIKVDHDLEFQPGWMLKVREILRDRRVGLLGLFKYELDPVDWRKTGVVRGTPATELRDEDLGPPIGYSFHTHICGSAMVIPRCVWRALGPFEEHSEAFAEDAVFQSRVRESFSWDCALPDEDLVRNHGFGVGPSTVVIAPNTVQPIHHEPRIYLP
jgi:glycosyltransferase involved in cell wall biosynthesis